MEEELNLAEYFKVIIKRKKMIIILTLFIIIAFTIYSYTQPKIYESESMVQLAVLPVFKKGGELESRFLYSPEESKNLIESSTILNPVLDKFYKEDKKPNANDFAKSFLDVEIVTEDIEKRAPLMPPFLKIRVKAYNPEISQKMTLAITNRWMDFLNEKFKIKKDLIFETFSKIENETTGEIIDVWTEDWYWQARKERIIIEMEYIDKKIKEASNYIKEIKKEISEIKSKTIAETDATTFMLYNTFLKDSRDDLMDREEALIEMEEDRRSLLIDFEEHEERMEAKKRGTMRSFMEVLIYMREPEILSYPEIPSEPINSRSFKQNLLIGSGLGLFVSVALAFGIEWYKKYLK